MELHLVDIANVILNEYKRSWWLWVSILILGILMVSFSDKLGTTRREKNKMLSAGSSLIGVSIVVHILALWGWL